MLSNVNYFNESKWNLYSKMQVNNGRVVPNEFVNQVSGRFGKRHPELVGVERIDTTVENQPEELSHGLKERQVHLLST